MIDATSEKSPVQIINSERSVSYHNDAPTTRKDNVADDQANGAAGNTAAHSSQWAQVADQQNAAQLGLKEEEAQRRNPSITLVKPPGSEDNGTQLSSSDGSGKPPSLDGKSVASGTTFALDEKESLRPDDSASLRAVEEEDVMSPPDSIAAGSRVGSDSGGARAFRDQLHEIAISQRAAPPGRFPNAVSHHHGHTLYDPNQAPNGIGRPMSQPIANGMATMGLPQSLPAIPDEKLMEALESPRDRLFVLKLEQDFIDFIKDSRETELALPHCNAFYRMLAHRLADYYLLGHIVDDTMTGVKISRTSYCRIPPPLSGLPVSSKSANTPPVDLPARKIMRRGEDGKSGTNTTANSEGPSQTTSEAGGGSGSDGGNEPESKEKSALTREEREARYREARQRIFGNAEPGEGESSESAGIGEGKDMSRSSSASGKKKSRKQRNYEDDFEARSRFSAYYPQPYPIPAFGGDQTMYYGGLPGPMHGAQYPGMNPNITPSSNYNTGYSVMVSQDAQTQYGWTGQQYPSPNAPMAYPNYGAANGYDLSADFQRGMQSFQTAGMSSQMTPKMANVPVAPYQDTYQSQPMPMNGDWMQMNQPPTYPNGQPAYSQGSPAPRPLCTPMQGNFGHHSYGQFSPSSHNGMSNRNQHPPPGSFNRQQFNPQSQAFIPGGRHAPYQMQANMGPVPGQGMNGFANYQMPISNQANNQMLNASPPVVHPPMYGSPTNHLSNNITPPKSNHMAPSLTANLSSAMHRTPSGRGGSGSIPAQSSIAKYGTPSHLPPKPPAPAQNSSSRFAITGTNANSLPRLAANIPPAHSTTTVTMRGGTGQTTENTGNTNDNNGSSNKGSNNNDGSGNGSGNNSPNGANGNQS
ncbi:uncharacterized protein EI97DRAFT_78762 [Westerdykella ornata]|uniref:SUZ domain-containing protein n=1 Tax=Westerdykella ornata TaxID=318751 RepID=A0A6A6JG07_WESOR|nr:uncharacterized protein EI97DRAFT_78762 [Westerdykella ornata]KAF2275154.1 hypothetical protein EI97DRAFT_78762 [Westerdykella ornata]